MSDPNYPAWKKVVWRLFRGSVSAALADVFLLRPDLSDPEEAVKLVIASFAVGFILAFGKTLREIFWECEWIRKIAI